MAHAIKLKPGDVVENDERLEFVGFKETREGKIWTFRKKIGNRQYSIIRLDYEQLCTRFGGRREGSK